MLISAGAVGLPMIVSAAVGAKSKPPEPEPPVSSQQISQATASLTGKAAGRAAKTRKPAAARLKNAQAAVAR